MRNELHKINNCRSSFKATFVRYGTKSAYKGPPIVTLLFEDVTNFQGQIVADHIWFTTTKGFDKYDFEEGDIVSFDARVKPYFKGYKGNRVDEDTKPIEKDYKLSHPNKILKQHKVNPKTNQLILF